MLKFRTSPFEDDIEKATHENNLSEDWSLIMHICDNATNFQDGAKFCLKAIMKRLYHQVPRVVLQTLTLLDACVKNCDRRFLLQVASSEFTSEVRKLLPKMHPSSSIKLKELLQRWSLEEFKDDPELCIIPSLYYKLKSEGIEFPSYEKEKPKAPVLCTNPDGVSSQEEENDIIKALEISLKDTGRYTVPEEYRSMESSKPLSEPFKVRALYDFDAAEDNELTIKTSEIVLVLDNSNSSWWKGSNHRGEGLFPSSFVTEDLDFKTEEPKIIENVAEKETASVVEEEVEVKLDEAKIETVLNWLSDVDPTEEPSDPEEMLVLEKQCYSMTPLIEENLQAIDNRLAKLNLVNEKIMAAFDLFHSLSDHVSFNQPLKYYPGTLSQHVIQFPHPQVTVPPTSMIHQSIPHPVPQELHTPATISSSSNQINPLPVSTIQSTMLQAPQMPSNSSMVPPPHQTVAEISQPISSTSSTSTASTVPYSQANSFPDVNVVSGYCLPNQAISYPMQYGPSMQQTAYIQAPAPGSISNIMALPYAVPPMRPYFPIQYYYVNSNPQPPIPTATATSTESTQECEQKSMSTSASEVNAAINSIPVTSNYSNDLNNLYFNTTSISDGPAEKQDITVASSSVNDTLHCSETSGNELIHKKNL